MAASVKSIAFRTSRLQSTKDFFEQTLKLIISESSARHFVVHSKNIRIVFIESTGDFRVELYVNSPYTNNAEAEMQEDPNGIKIIVTENTSSQKPTE